MRNFSHLKTIHLPTLLQRISHRHASLTARRYDIVTFSGNLMVSDHFRVLKRVSVSKFYVPKSEMLG
jgi:hypothetical protein